MRIYQLAAPTEVLFHESDLAYSRFFKTYSGTAQTVLIAVKLKFLSVGACTRGPTSPPIDVLHASSLPGSLISVASVSRHEI